MGHSVILQAVCDNNRRFTQCFAGFPGSAHDARVLYNSHLYKKIDEDTVNFFPTKDGYHIVGDSAYPLLPWLMVPFKDHGGLTALQSRYNKKHSQTRMVIECAFALLKGRFRRMKMVAVKLEFIPQLILASCVLHNLCLDRGDDADELLEIDDMRVIEEAQTGCSATESQHAKTKRDYIVSVL